MNTATLCDTWDVSVFGVTKPGHCQMASEEREDSLVADPAAKQASKGSGEEEG